MRRLRARPGSVRRHVERFQEIDRFDIPWRREPGNSAALRMLVYRRILVNAELHPVPVIDIAHPTPGSVTFNLPLVAWSADLERTLLELDRIAACVGCLVDQGDCISKLAIVIDADLTSDVNRWPAPTTRSP